MNVLSLSLLDISDKDKLKTFNSIGFCHTRSVILYTLYILFDFIHIFSFFSKSASFPFLDMIYYLPSKRVKVKGVVHMSFVLCVYYVTLCVNSIEATSIHYTFIGLI